MIEAELPQFTKTIKDKLEGLQQANKSTVVFLSGELGAGKTTFTKAFAKEVGITEDITSPTFVILKRYEIVGSVFKNLIHIDAYRLKGYDELVKIKFPDYLSNAENLIFIEWPEMVESQDLVADLTLKFNHSATEGERLIEVS
jgi:tRNA threonylcarbamoyladenosine biosynthesis protein TsaE